MQTFSEYPAVSNVLPAFAGTIIVSLFFSLAATLLSIAYLYMMVIVPKGRLRYGAAAVCLVLRPATVISCHTVKHISPHGRCALCRPWLQRKASVVFIPAVLLAGGVLGILVGVPCLAYILYPVGYKWPADLSPMLSASIHPLAHSLRPPFVLQPLVLWVTIGFVALAVIYMLCIRVVTIAAVPIKGATDLDLPPRGEPTCWSLFTQTHLIENLLYSDLNEVCHIPASPRAPPPTLFFGQSAINTPPPADHLPLQRALFNRLRNILQAVAFVAALLALTSTDALREIPPEV